MKQFMFKRIYGAVMIALTFAVMIVTVLMKDRASWTIDAAIMLVVACAGGLYAGFTMLFGDHQAFAEGQRELELAHAGIHPAQLAAYKERDYEAWIGPMKHWEPADGDEVEEHVLETTPEMEAEFDAMIEAAFAEEERRSRV